jgi:hypothetical protein
MPAPTFDPDTGGRQPIDTRSKHDFALNSHNFTVTIEATSWGNGVDLQQHVGGGGVWKSLLNEPPVKRPFCKHMTLATGSYRVVTGNAVGVVCEIMSP